jgi:hypothetical protein
MSTFLQLVNRLRSECGVSGSDYTTVVGATGEQLRLVRWINAGWKDVQNLHADWNFLRQSFTFNTNTVTNQSSYTPAQCNTTNFGNWKKDSLRIYTTSLGFSNEMILRFAPYDEFRNLYLYGSSRTTYTKPTVFSIDPQKNLVLGAPPDLTGYTVNGEYYQLPTELVLDADVPVMPAQFHDAIFYKAMTHYAGYENAAEVNMRGASEYKNLMYRLHIDQLPTMTFGAPLC